MTSPYEGSHPNDWVKITQKLIEAHPLRGKNLSEAVLASWNQIVNGAFCGLQIGKDFIPQPQILGFLLHEIIPIHITTMKGNNWRKQKEKNEKDIVYVPDPKFSIEIKTSSDRKKIFGNRSYGQQATNSSRVGKVDKSGYYLAVNFEKFVEGWTELPRIRRIRFGWIDSSDWRSQSASTGQQASLSPEVEAKKLVVLWEA